LCGAGEQVCAQRWQAPVEAEFARGQFEPLLHHRSPWPLPDHPLAEIRIIVLAAMQFAHAPHDARGAVRVMGSEPVPKQRGHFARQSQDDPLTLLVSLHL